MVKVQNGSLGQISEGLTEIMKCKLPMKTAMKLKAVAREIANLFEDFQELERALIDRHTRKDEEGNPVPGDREGTVQISNIQEFSDEFTELLQVENEVSPILVSWFPEDLEVETETLFKLGELLVDE